MHKFNAMGGNALHQSPVHSITFDHIVRTHRIGFKDAKFAVRGFIDQPKVRTVYMPFPPRFQLRNVALPWTLLQTLDDHLNCRFSGMPLDEYTPDKDSFMYWPMLFLDGGKDMLSHDELPVRYLTGFTVNVHGCFIMDFDPERSGKIWVAGGQWCHREDRT